MLHLDLPQKPKRITGSHRESSQAFPGRSPQLPNPASRPTEPNRTDHKQSYATNGHNKPTDSCKFSKGFSAWLYSLFCPSRPLLPIANLQSPFCKRTVFPVCQSTAKTPENATRPHLSLRRHPRSASISAIALQTQKSQLWGRCIQRPFVQPRRNHSESAPPVVFCAKYAADRASLCFFASITSFLSGSQKVLSLEKGLQAPRMGAVRQLQLREFAGWNKKEAGTGEDGRRGGLRLN